MEPEEAAAREFDCSSLLLYVFGWSAHGRLCVLAMVLITVLSLNLFCSDLTPSFVISREPHWGVIVCHTASSQFWLPVLGTGPSV